MAPPRLRRAFAGDEASSIVSPPAARLANAERFPPPFPGHRTGPFRSARGNPFKPVSPTPVSVPKTDHEAAHSLPSRRLEPSSCGRYRRHLHRHRGVRRRDRQAHVRQGAVDAAAVWSTASSPASDKAGSGYADRRRCSCTARPSPSTPSWSAPARKTALLITEGFRDIYEIGRINRPDAYNLFFQKHVPLVERALRFEVKRAHAVPTARSMTPLDEAEVAALRPHARRARHRGGRDPVPQLLRQRRPRGAREGDPREEPSEHVRLRLARAVAGISRVRALLDGRRQRLYRAAASAAISARSTTTSASAGFAGSFLIVQSTGGPLRGRAGARPMRAHAGIGARRRRDRHAGALSHARPRERHRLRHGRHHRQGRRHPQGRGADHRARR